MQVSKTVLRGGKAALSALSTRSAANAVPKMTAIASEWETEKGSMVYKDPVDEQDTAYIKTASDNGLMTDLPLLTEESDYLSEAHTVDYTYKGPCDNMSSLQLNSSTQLLLENAGTSQPMSVHYPTVGAYVPTPANLGGTGLSHMHFKGAAGGLGAKFVANSLIKTHPSRQLYTSAVARQQGIQDAAPTVDLDQPQAAANTQGIQGDTDSAQARLWVSRCLGDGLYTDCELPPETPGKQRQTIQSIFVQMLADIRAAAEAQLRFRSK
ncbi:hypothetical protein BOX15_Mlig010733g1 [Macrostomum lignano]|uniref:Uncharacterized protein n=1 Tax=Macrostomum lignano TaxID=282301 RepID=A0A267E483_9PLAT|nr:hypothetical protein BOX15_Mlig010733g1 [Macrostomum lignano]